MTYLLHYAPDNASLIVRLALEELGVPYQTVLVDRAARAQDSAAYRAINPAGLIPVLETPQGPVFETAAILLWLADTHNRMAPKPDAPERGAFLRTLFFMSNTLHAQMRMVFYPWKYVGTDDDAQAALRSQLQTRHDTDVTLPASLQVVNDFVSMHSGADPSIIDLYAAALVRWCALYPANHTGWFDLRAYPALWDVAARIEDRASAKAAALAEGLGATPFTAPSPPNPPEGTAL